MSKTETANVTANATTTNFVIGQLFTRKSDKAQGELIEDNKIRFEHPITKTFHSAPLTDKWQLNAIQDAKQGKTPSDIPVDAEDVQTPSIDAKTPISIDDLAENFNAKHSEAKTDDVETAKAKGKKAKTDDTEKVEVLTDAEVVLRKELEKQFLKLKSETEKAEIAVVKNPFKLAKIIAEIRAKRLYRNTHKNMESYSIEVLKIERQNALAYASIGEYAKIAEFYLEREKIDVSFKASNRLVVNQNALRDSLKMPKTTDLSEFETLLSEVVEITGKVARNDNIKDTDNVSLTPRIIDETAKVINSEITSGLSNQTFDVNDTIARATAVLQGRKAQVITKAKIALQAQPKKDLPNCESHSDVTKMKVVSLANGILTLDCGCVFKHFIA